jgi:hypothetical protein
MEFPVQLMTTSRKVEELGQMENKLHRSAIYWVPSEAPNKKDIKIPVMLK